MDTAKKAAFVAWLRQLHAEQRQARLVLKQAEPGKKPCYCAAGALYELFHQATGEGRWEQKPNEPTEFYFQLPDGLYGASVGEDVRKWAGMADDVYLTLLNGHDASLSHINDVERYTLSDIADLVESQW